MRSTVRRSLLPAALVSAALALAGCSAAPSSYSSPEALQKAYTDAGGDCEKPMEVGEDMLSEGAHGIACGDPIVFLIVFDSEDAKNRYIARTGGSEGYRVGGERWLATGIAGDDAKESLDKLGGEPIK